MRTFEGRAKVGDVYLTAYGELREVVAIMSAASLVSSAWFGYQSHSSLAVALGDTTGREKRNIARYRAKCRGERAA